MARVATLFSFVAQLVDARAGEPDPVPDGLALLRGRAGEHEGPAVILAALLLAVGERVRVECTREMAFVRIEVHAEDLPELPPHARLIRGCGRLYLPLDPRRRGSPLGFLPLPVCEALARRRRLLRWGALRSDRTVERPAP